MTSNPLDSSAAPGLVRLSISLPAALSAKLDAMVAEREVANRSQMIAELIRAELAQHSARERPDSTLAGTITLVYRAESGKVRMGLAQVQLGYAPEIISGQHIFLANNQAMEVLLVQGTARRLHNLRDALRQTRGVQQCGVVTTTALLPPLPASKNRP